MDKPTFQEANRRLHELIQLGHGVVDIALIMGEEFPRDLAEKVLENARNNGEI